MKHATWPTPTSTPMALFLAVPLGALAAEAASEHGAAFVRIWRDAQFLNALRNTLLLGGMSF
ncbi:MAG: hypothetical protein H7Z77_10710 [Chitinophagaceae bacterium]|nr:hypothetical protein [Polaromonas sp.]